MTTYNKTSLKTFFENGDVPTGQNYSDFIDSCVNLAETASQSMAGALSPTELVTARVSAGNGVFTGTLQVAGVFSAQTMAVNSLNVTNGIVGGSVETSALNATLVSANSVNVTSAIGIPNGKITASAGRFVSGIYGGTGIVSAAGTTQGAATALSFVINIGAGVADGSTTGFLLRNNNSGMIQYIVNGGASANLWPASECKINALSTNAAFGMASNTLYTIVHTTNSAYAVA